MESTQVLQTPVRAYPPCAVGHTCGVTIDVVRAELGGIPVLSAASAGRAHGALVFRVGHSDEALTRRGITHLIEHLALHPQDPRAIDFNGFVDLTTTVLHCQADTLDEVGTFLTSVSRTLAALPYDRMEKEARVLRAEAAQRSGSSMGTALWLRFGPTGFGALDYEELFLHHPSQRDVERHRMRFFTRGNAAVVLSGPVPATLDLSALPAGERIPIGANLPIEQQFPAWTVSNANAVRATFVLPRAAAVPAALFVVTAALRDLLREQLAISYDVGTAAHVLSSTHTHHVLYADCRPADAGEVLARMQTELRRIVYDGCAPDLLDEYQRLRGQQEAQPGASLGAAHYLANEILYGNDAVDFVALAAEADQLTVADVQRVVQLVLDGALWLVPTKTRVTDQRLHLVTQWSTWAVNGQRFTPVRPEERNTLIASFEGVTLSVPDRGYISVSFDRLVACKAWADGARTLYGNDGFTLTVHPADWVAGPDVVALIDRQVPRDFVVSTADPLRAA